MKGNIENARLEEKIRDLQKELSLLRSLADSSHEWEMLVDKNRQLLYISPSFEKITGYKVSDVKDHAFILSLIHPEDKEIILGFEKKFSQRNPKSHSCNIRLYTKDRTLKWIRLSCSPVFGKQKNLIGLRWTIRDITESKQAEQALLESEKKYRLLSQITSDDGSSLILQNDGSFKREWFIDTLSKKYGYDQSEFDSIEKWARFVHPDDKKKFFEAIDKLKKGNDISVQLRIITKTGETRWIQDTIKPSIDPETKKIRLLSAVKDITDLKNAEISFLDNEEKFKAIFNTIDLGIIQSNGTGGFDVVNDSFVGMIGYSRSELKELKIYDITYTEDLRKEFDAFNKVVKNKESRYTLEKRFVRSDNSIMLCRATHHLLYDEYKNVKQVLAVIQDITEQRKAELALLESEQKYRNLTENIDDIICKCDSDLRILFVNKAVERFNVKIDQFIGKKVPDLDLPQELKSYLLEFLQFVIKTKKPSQTTVKHSVLDNDVFFSCRFSPEFDGTGTKVNFIHGVCSDITELIKVEQELIKAKEKAEESDRLKSIFLANMSHEIRTPMNAIVGFAALLENENMTPETRKKYIEIINHSAENLLTIINDILDISKIEAGQLEVYNVSFNLHQILLDAQAQFEMQKKVRGKDNIQIILANECQNEFILYSDEVRIQQVLTNLLNNALKFIEKGYIEYGYEVIRIDNNPFLRFYVKDTGIGIAEDKKKIIFERFRQEEESIHTTHDGTGLGLAISKGILDLMGGSIWVETMKGEGTKFYFTVPYRNSENNTEKKEVKTQIASDFIFMNKNILIVDDTPEIHQYFTEVLTKTGANLMHAYSAKETFSCMESNSSIDIILMDIRLPDMNGLELTKIIKKRINIPIIVQTAFALSSDRQQILEAGCDDYITKPIDRLQLLMCLSKFLYDSKPLW